MGSKARERHRNRVIVTQAARSYLNLQNYIQNNNIKITTNVQLNSNQKSESEIHNKATPNKSMTVDNLDAGWHLDELGQRGPPM